MIFLVYSEEGLQLTKDICISEMAYFNYRPPLELIDQQRALVHKKIGKITDKDIANYIGNEVRADFFISEGMRAPEKVKETRVKKTIKATITSASMMSISCQPCFSFEGDFKEVEKHFESEINDYEYKFRDSYNAYAKEGVYAQIKATCLCYFSRYEALYLDVRLDQQSLKLGYSEMLSSLKGFYP